MKTILVDAYNTLVTDEGINQDMYQMLEKFENKKIILTNADTEKQVELGLVDLPYEMFTMSFNPFKSDPNFYTTMLDEYNIAVGDTIYFEHNKEAVESARSVGIQTFQYDYENRNVDAVERFLTENL
ncbi:HAD-IA family hydrolase [Candidatus Gracilibacteria bacterium]|nr:HAD-IA family hydrolase [Candidatus Gracilibacteria bacterium]